MPVSLFVSSRTAKAEWGRVPSDETCTGTHLPEAFVVVGAVSHVPFTACDGESLPVVHSLPSAADPRRFTATLNGTSSPLTYLGDGLYEVSVLVERHGTDVLQVEIDGAVVSPPLNLVARCPGTGRTASLSTGARV